MGEYIISLVYFLFLMDFIAMLTNTISSSCMQAFVYVGLYGYSYLEAGRNVITLFKNRGWEAIIADDLISNGE